MVQNPTIVSSMTKPVFDYAVQTGLSRQTLLASANLSEEALERIDGRISYYKHLALWQTIEQITPDPYFGIHFAQSESCAALLDIVGYLVVNSQTLGEGLARAVRFRTLLSDCAIQSAEIDEDTIRIIDGPRMGPPWPRHYAESALAIYIVLARKLSSKKLKPEKVSFCHSRPANLEGHEAFFQSPLSFSQPRNEIIFPVHLLDLPIISSDPQLGAHLERHAQEMLDHMPHDDEIHKITKTITKLLPEGNPSLSLVATSLGMGERTLQRRLRESSIGFREILDRTRHELALRYLKDKSLTINECSFLLGFTSSSTFCRAFLRWTGKTPKAFRADFVNKHRSIKH